MLVEFKGKVVDSFVYSGGYVTTVQEKVSEDCVRDVMVETSEEAPFLKGQFVNVKGELEKCDNYSASVVKAQIVA